MGDTIDTTETQVVFRPRRIVGDLYRDVVRESLGRPDQQQQLQRQRRRRTLQPLQHPVQHGGNIAARCGRVGRKLHCPRQRAVPLFKPVHSGVVSRSEVPQCAKDARSQGRAQEVEDGCRYRRRTGGPHLDGGPSMGNMGRGETEVGWKAGSCASSQSVIDQSDEIVSSQSNTP